eukprot:jgi/Tetstr1/430405/TSEL_020215.t1
MANFKELVAAHEGGENPRLADSSSYKPEIDVIVEFLSAHGARQANIDGSHRREAKRMVKENYPEIYNANKGIHLTSAKMYIGLSPEVCRYMSMKLNEAGHTVVGDTSMHKLLDVGFGPHAPWLDEPSLAKQSDSADLPVGQMYLVVGLLIQGEHSVTPSLYELVDDIKHAGNNGPMAVPHTNAEWLSMIETWRFRDLLRRASIKLMNAIGTAKGHGQELQLLTPDEPARNWGKYLSDHIIEMDVDDKVSDEQAAARLDAITKFRAKVDDLGPTGFPRKFQDLFKEHIAATNTTIRSEAYRIKNQMPDLVISFFTEFALLACAPELIAVSAPNVSNELWISMKAGALPVMPKGEKVDKDEEIWLDTELCKTCIVEGNFKAPATKQFVADAMSAVRAKKATVFIADALFGAGSHTWDSKDAAWGTDDFNDVFAFARQDNPHNPAALLLVRCRVAQVALHLDRGHSDDCLGPVLLLMAGSPCTDALSVDAFVASVRAAWASSPATAEADRGARLASAVLTACRGWPQALRDSCRRRSRAYSAPLVFAALFLGLFYLSSGLSKANWGSTFIISWAKEGFLHSHMMGMWLRRWGEPMVPSLRRVVTNPLLAGCETYLFPVVRSIHKAPGLIQAGGAVAVGWECLHWYFLLCGPWVRTLSMILAVCFHLTVAFFMGISFYSLAALQVALFTPWGALLDRLILDRWLPEPELDSKNTEEAASAGNKSPLVAPNLTQRPLVWATVAVGLLLVVGQSLVLVQSLHLKHNACKRCYPFDHGPKFVSHGHIIPAGNGTYTVERHPEAARLISRHMVLHLEGGAPPVRLPVWQAVCIVGGYKEECMLPRQGEVSFWCCRHKSKAYPHNLMRTFEYKPKKVGGSGTQVSSQHFRSLGALALAEPSLLPPGETRRVIAVSFETAPVLRMHVHMTIPEIMAQAQPHMECEELVMRPGVDLERANVTRTCQQGQQPTEESSLAHSNHTEQARPRDQRSTARRSQTRGLNPVRLRHKELRISTEQAPPHGNDNTASRPQLHRFGFVRRRHTGLRSNTAT